MSLAGYLYAHEHGLSKSKPQKRFGKTIRFKLVDLMRPDAYYIFTIEQLLCIYSALYWSAKPFFGEKSAYNSLKEHFCDSFSSGSPIIYGGYHDAFSLLRERIVELMLSCDASPDTLRWRESLRLTRDMAGILGDVELPSPPHYKGRHTMPIPQFSSLGDYFSKVFGIPEKVERLKVVASDGKNANPFILLKGVAIVTFNPEEYGYFMARMDYTFSHCPLSRWDFYVHSKPGQTFVDFLIQLHEIYDSLKSSRKSRRLLTPVYEHDKDSQFCRYFYIK